MKKQLTLLLLCTGLTYLIAQDQVIPLWPEGIPCENNLELEIKEDNRIGRRLSNVHSPELFAYFPKTGGNGTSVIICPGGGYTILAWDWEGVKMAEWFNSFGITAFVLKYRLPKWESEECRDKVALMDAQRAMRIVRSKAEAWNLESDRIGIMGFSAGGHLASSLSTHYDIGDPNNTITFEQFSCRPDFSVLMYPVVTMNEAETHKGSRNNLIGKAPQKERASYYSNEAQITEDTPPAILIHANDDKGVIPENSVNYYMALRRSGVPAAMHIYEGGGHGFSFGEGKGAVSQWPMEVKGWMDDRGLLQRPIKVLIVDGQNNHKNWPETTPILKSHLAKAKIFKIDVATSPAKGEPMGDFRPNFSNYDVVVSNYNGDLWSEQTQKDFETFVKNGGGFVSVHAADNAFPKWNAYNEIIGLGGWYGRDENSGPYVYLDENEELKIDKSPGKGGHHGKQHKFVVQMRDTGHPITKGLRTKWMHYQDELYDQLRGPAKNMHILATAFSDVETGGTGRHEPMMMTIHYGLGRVFHTPMGHSNESMLCKGFQTVFLRGVEWAATGEVTQATPKEFPSETEVMLVEKDK